VNGAGKRRLYTALAGEAQAAIFLPRTGCLFPRVGFKDWRVYQAAELLREEVDRILRKVPVRFKNEAQHIDEAADSILNNIAEGSAFRYPKKRIYFWQVAKGSANEVSGGLQSLVNRGALRQIEVWRAISLAISIAKMLNNMN
jgi:four helix bundle protein